MTTDNPDTIYREGCRLYGDKGGTDGDRRRAEAIFHGLLEKDPGHHQSINMLGLCHEARRERRRAQELFREALYLSPRCVYALNLGLSLMADNRPDEALAAFNRALELEWRYPAAHFNLGLLYHMQGRAAEARSSWRQAYRMDADYPGLRFRLAQAEAAAGDIPEAEKLLREGIDRFPHEAELHAGLSSILEHGGRHGEAAELWRRFISANAGAGEETLREARSALVKAEKARGQAPAGGGRRTTAPAKRASVRGRLHPAPPVEGATPAPISEQGEREGEAPSGSAGGGGDASPYEYPHGEREGEAPSGSAGGGGDASPYEYPHGEREGKAPSGSAGGGGDARPASRKGGL